MKLHNSILRNSLKVFGRMAGHLKLHAFKRQPADTTPDGCVLHGGSLYRTSNGNYQRADKITGELVWRDLSYFHVDVGVRVELLKMVAAARPS
jgi:hypothetical protein